VSGVKRFDELHQSAPPVTNPVARGAIEQLRRMGVFAGYSMGDAQAGEAFVALSLVGGGGWVNPNALNESVTGAEPLFVDVVVPIWMVASARIIGTAWAVRTGRVGARRFNPGVTCGTEIGVVTIAVEDRRPALFAQARPHGLTVSGQPQTGGGQAEPAQIDPIARVTPPSVPRPGEGDYGGIGAGRRWLPKPGRSLSDRRRYGFQ